MTAMLCELALLAIVVVIASASDGHCTSFRRRYLHVGEGLTRPSCPAPRSIHTPSGGDSNRNVTAPSAVMCGLICMRDGICESFRYCQDQNVCQLNTTLPQETVKTMRSTGCVSFEEIQEESKEALVTEVPSTSVAPPCWSRTTAPGKYLRIPSALPATLRLEFKAEIPGRREAHLKFSANTASENELYTVEMSFTESSIGVKIIKASASGTSTSGKSSSGISLIGSVIVITIDGGLITLDEQDSGYSYSNQDPNSPQVTSWDVEFGGDQHEIKWDFFDPCINPF